MAGTATSAMAPPTSLRAELAESRKQQVLELNGAISLKTGSTSPDRTERRFDLCPACLEQVPLPRQTATFMARGAPITLSHLPSARAKPDRFDPGYGSFKTDRVRMARPAVSQQAATSISSDADTSACLRLRKSCPRSSITFSRRKAGLGRTKAEAAFSFSRATRSRSSLRRHRSPVVAHDSAKATLRARRL
ncbi:hypothetical protein ACVIWU_007023 [Bradyrhizobium sp. USDA 4509]